MAIYASSSRSVAGGGAGEQVGGGDPAEEAGGGGGCEASGTNSERGSAFAGAAAAVEAGVREQGAHVAAQGEGGVRVSAKAGRGGVRPGDAQGGRGNLQENQVVGSII